jgi:hypothetical protein
VVQRREGKVFLVAAWLLSVCTVAHIISGTLIFSSMKFIGAWDALSILGRYMVSVLSCRVVLVYELSVLRNLHAGALQLERKEHIWCEHLECGDCGGHSFLKDMPSVRSSLYNNKVAAWLVLAGY